MVLLHNFMAVDLTATLLAVCLFPLVVVIPGYGIARLFDLFEFRRRTPAFQLTVSIPLSIAVSPILTFLAGRFSGIAVWVLFAAFGVYFLWAVMQDVHQHFPLRRSPQALVFAGIAAVWLAVALLSLVDLQFGDRNYYSTLALDYSLRTSLIHSISTTGIPPQNPFFHPGQAFPLRYHYFWLILCSLVDQLGGAAVNPRQAMIAGTFWCGVGLMAIVTLYSRIFSFQGQASFRKRVLIGILLLGVTGLDLIPTLFLQQVFHMVQASMDWWNEQVVGFVSSALWVPHYLAGLIACLTGFLVLWDGARQASTRRRAQHAIVGGIALASAVGASIYVSFVFGVFLMVWTAVTVWKKWKQETVLLLLAGMVAVVLSVPYLLDLRGSGSGAEGGGALLQFHVRSFKLAEMAMSAPASGQGWRIAFVNSMLLPLNYFLELGFFLIAGVMWWRQRRSSGQPWTRPELALGLMVGTSLLICTFVRSSVIGNNDLGWRGFLVAQFGLLLCAVDVLTGPRLAFGGVRRGFLGALLAIGAGGSLYDVAILRLYPVLADRGTVTMVGWMAPDRQLGKRNYALREAYEWAARSTGPAALVQYDPHVVLQDTPAFFYADRPILAGNESCLATFGGDPALCAPVIAKLNEVYPAAGRPAVRSLEAACQGLPLDVLVAKDTDLVWRSLDSWVWTGKPAFANRYVRVFRCENAGMVKAAIR